MDGNIPIQAIEQMVPEHARAHIRISSSDLPISAWPVIFAFETALNAILPKVRLTTPIQVLFGARPFQVAVSNGTFVFDLEAGAVNGHVENIIFIDVARTSEYLQNGQVTAILEELVHTMMNIPDEVLVKHVVALLYSGIGFDGIRYIDVHRVTPSD